MKYIDAEKLKSEIERHIKEVKDVAKRFTPNMGFFDAKLSGIYDVMAILDSLQQEQPEVELDKLVNEEFASHSRTTEYGLEATYNRAELYQLIKRMSLVFNARKEEEK